MSVVYGPQPLRSLNTEMRHGFEDQYQSEDFLAQLAQDFIFYYGDRRHLTNGVPTPEEERQADRDRNYQPIPDWKVSRGRQKTVSAALLLCLNLGVDPPDVIKTRSCARKEAWVDPLSFQDSKKAIEQIGRNLQSQYETLSLRTRYKQSLDPCVEDVKRFCNSLRRTSKDDQILFHYNGHGVPQPTASGEIWVFNRGYTQYIPVSLYDLQTWLGAPCVFVYDCSSAGNIVTNFKRFVEKRIKDDEMGCHDMAAPSPTSAYRECFQLASCRAGELLPMHPELPADLFTCCLTCPIEISIRVFLMQSKLKTTKYRPLFEQFYPYKNCNRDSEEKMFNSVPNISIPGSLSDRRTPLGELNWIFTAITDTIAWTSLPKPLFKKLFRHDLMMAALFRNFLLAKRIMPWYNCHPVSDPELPDSVTQHPLWKSWDLAIDEVLGKLVADLQKSSTNGGDSGANSVTGGVQDGGNLGNHMMFQQQETLRSQQQRDEPGGSVQGQSRFAVGNLSTMSLSTHPGLQNASVTNLAAANLGKNSAMINSSVPQAPQQQFTGFFERNLSAFELWLKYESYQRNPPEQLPIVLQVLLSQVHRVRALVLLSRFLDLGPWAVYLSLSIGIFPYVLKLLQSPAPELKPILVFIWARIMSVDYKNTQLDLAKEKGFMYFINILTPDFGSIPTSLYGTPLTAGPPSSSSSSHNLAITPQNVGYEQQQQQLMVTPRLTYSSIETTDEQKSMSVFVLASFIRDFPMGQQYCFDVELLKKLCFYIEVSEIPLLRQWCLILIGLLYEQNPLHKYISMNVGIFDVLLKSLGDPVPEVRTAVIYAFRCFISDANDSEKILRLRQELEQQSQQLNAQLVQLLNNSAQTKQQVQQQQQQQQQHTEQQQMKLEHQLNVCTSLQAQLECIDPKAMKTRGISNLIAVLTMINDGSSLVRKEILVYFSQVVHRYLNFFIIVAFNEMVEDIAQFEGLDPDTVNYFEKHSVTYGSVFNTVWKALLILAGDPYLEIRKMAGDIIDCILSELKLHKDLGEPFLELEAYYLKRNIGVNVGTRTGFSASKAQIRSFASSKRFESTTDNSDSDVKSNRGSRLLGSEHSMTAPDRQKQQSSLRGLSLRELFKTLTLRDASIQDESISLINPDEKRTTGISLLSVTHGVAQIPPTPRFQPRQNPESAVKLPLTSTFFDYCREYFQEPQMRKQETDEVGSVAYNRRVWRRNRNETIIETTQAQKKLALYGDWSNKLATLDNKTQPKLLRFTQFEDQLVVADDRDNISVFDWREKKMLSRFSNGNPFGTKITDMQFVNEDDETLVMTGSSDGVVKIYKDAWSNEKVTTVAAWRGLTEMLLTPRSNGLILEWQQIRGSLLATGDVKIIRIWDAHTETVEVDIPAKTSALITSLTSDQLVGDIFVGGFSDGTLRVYDRRVNTRNSMVRRWRTQGGGRDVWINNVHMQRGGYRELVSGATNGVVELWDIRAEDPVKTFTDENMQHAGGSGGGKRAMTMTSTQVHEHAPVIASSTKQIKIWTTSGDRLSSFKNSFGGIGNGVANTIAGAAGIRNTLSYTSFTSNSFVSALEFHPHRMMLAAANSHDTRINIFDCVSRNQSYY